MMSLRFVVLALFSDACAQVALDIDESVAAVAGNQLDFVFTYPSLYTCFSAQFGSRVVASVQSSRRLTTPPYAAVPLSFFGGVFFTLANRSDISSLSDLAGKRLEGADVRDQLGCGAGAVV